MIYLYTGENDYEIAERVRAVRTAFTKKYSAESIERIDGAEVPAEDLVAKLVNMDLFATRKLLVISGTAKKTGTWEKVATTLSRVPDTTEVVLIEPKPDGRLSATRLVKKIAKWTEFKPIKGRDIVNWARKKLQEQGMKATGMVVEKLVMVCGENQWRVASEIKKLSAITKVLSEDLVDRYVKSDTSGDVFKMLELAFAGNADKMNEEIARVRERESAEMFLGLLAGQLFALVGIKNSEGRDVPRELGIHPFVAQKLRRVADGVSDEALSRLAQEVAEVDGKMKLGSDGWRLLYKVLNELVVTTSVTDRN